jgi:two-component system alkaline phosphatase synthesis response regulator PhoP
MQPALVLVVEDESDIRTLLTITLELHGFQVIEATNGQEAIEKALSLKPDLVLMDVRMPLMNGIEACQVLKANERTRQIPVVFLSARDREADIEQGLAAGAAAYLLKPFDPKTLPGRLAQILFDP